MKEEAAFTRAFDRQRSTVGYRKLPVPFVKAKEIYDPSKFIKSLIQQNHSTLFAKKQPGTQSLPNRANSLCERLESPNVLQSADEMTGIIEEATMDFEAITSVQVIDEQVLYEENLAIRVDSEKETPEVLNEVQDSTEKIPTPNAEQGILNEIKSDLEHSYGRNADDMRSDDCVLTRGSPDYYLNKGISDRLNQENSDDCFLNQVSSDEYNSDEEQSSFDENDVSALSFLISSDMAGGDDIFIDDLSSPPLEHKQKSHPESAHQPYDLRGIEKIIKTNINSENELEFVVHRSLGGSSTIVETVSYEQVLMENEEYATSEQIDLSIRFLGGIINFNEAKQKITTDIADMVATLSNLQGNGSKKAKKRASNKLSTLAREQDATFDSSSITSHKKRQPSFSSADPLLRESLIAQWHEAKKSKAVKKQAREELRAEGKLSKGYKELGTITLKDRFPEKMSIFDAVNAMQTFLSNPDQNSLAFPPMNEKPRKVINNLARAYYLTPKTIGERKDRFVLCTKTYKSSYEDRDRDLITLLINTHASKKLPIAKAKIQANGGGKKATEIPKVQKAVQTYREGDLVGHEASEIDHTNRGRRMLEKLGWKEGMTLGHTNPGIATPIFAKVKNKKYGLGF